MNRKLKVLWISLSILIICIGSGFSAWHFHEIFSTTNVSIEGNGTITAVDMIDKIGEIDFNCNRFTIELDESDKNEGIVKDELGNKNVYCGVNIYAYEGDNYVDEIISTFVPNERFFNMEFNEKDYKIKFVLEPYTTQGQLYTGLLKFVQFGFGKDENYIASSNERIVTKDEISNPDHLVFPAIKASYINQDNIYKPTTLTEYFSYVEKLKEECNITNGDEYSFNMDLNLRITMYLLTTCPNGHENQQYNTSCTQCGEYVGGDLYE